MPGSFSRSVVLIQSQSEDPGYVDKAKEKVGDVVKAPGLTHFFEVWQFVGLPGRFCLLLVPWFVDSGLPLGWRIFLSSRRHAVDDRYADKTDNAYANSLLWHVQQVGADREADGHQPEPLASRYQRAPERYSLSVGFN